MSKITIILTILGTLLIIGSIVFWGVKDAKKFHRLVLEEKTRLNICRDQRETDILNFILECTQSLQVEENAYVVRDCEKIALRNICH